MAGGEGPGGLVVGGAGGVEFARGRGQREGGGALGAFLTGVRFASARESGERGGDGDGLVRFGESEERGERGIGGATGAGGFEVGEELIAGRLVGGALFVGEREGGLVAGLRGAKVVVLFLVNGDLFAQGVERGGFDDAGALSGGVVEGAADRAGLVVDQGGAEPRDGLVGGGFEEFERGLGCGERGDGGGQAGAGDVVERGGVFGVFGGEACELGGGGLPTCCKVGEARVVGLQCGERDLLGVEGGSAGGEGFGIEGASGLIGRGVRGGGLVEGALKFGKVGADFVGVGAEGGGLTGKGIGFTDT